MNTLRSPSLLGVFDDVQVSNRRKRNHSALLGAKTLLAFMAMMFTLLNLYRGTVVSRNFNSGIRHSGIRSASGGKRLVSVSDLQLYPAEFQDLHRKRTENSPSLTEEQRDPSSWNSEMRSRIHRKFQKHNRESIYSLLLLPQDDNDDEDEDEPNTDNAIFWNGEELPFMHEYVRKRHKQGFYQFFDMVGRDLETDEEEKVYRADPAVKEAAWGSKQGQKPRLIWEHNICDAFRNAKLYANFSTPHVLITHLNENWGTLSSEVKDRTAMWGDVLGSVFGNKNGGDCQPMELKELYLDSPSTLAVFTVQHQSILDHPKIHSIPIGMSRGRNSVKSRIKFLKKQKELIAMYTNRTHNRTHSNNLRPRLLMINSSPTKTRTPQNNAIIDIFARANITAENTYGSTETDYFVELSVSKFIMSPSGMGWDCYRIWEALVMGVIPVIEKHKYRYEVLKYPAESGKQTEFIRLLKRGESGGNLTIARASRGGKRLGNALQEDNIRQHNASIEIVEYHDRFRGTLDDLPVLWVDGEFGELPPPGEERDGKKYLTPELLEREYDAIAAKMDTFKYEKLTSLYWLSFMESFLLLTDPNRYSGDGSRSFESSTEEETWQAALESLSATHNNHTFLPTKEGGFWVGWQDVMVDTVGTTIETTNTSSTTTGAGGSSSIEKNELRHACYGIRLATNPVVCLGLWLE